MVVIALKARRAAAAAEARKQDSEAAEDTSEGSTNPDDDANMYEDLFTAVMMATDQDNRPLHTVFQLLPSKKVIKIRYFSFFAKTCKDLRMLGVMLAQMVACLPLVQQVQGSIPGGDSKFSFENFQPRG